MTKVAGIYDDDDDDDDDYDDHDYHDAVTLEAFSALTSLLLYRILITVP